MHARPGEDLWNVPLSGTRGIGTTGMCAGPYPVASGLHRTRVINTDDSAVGENLFQRSAIFFFFSFIFISWRLITLQYCSGSCHTLKWISHGFTCVPHPDPPSHLPLQLIPLGLPSAPGLTLVSCIPPGLVICFTIDNIHAVLSKHPTLAFSHRVQKFVLYKRSAILCSLALDLMFLCMSF